MYLACSIIVYGTSPPLMQYVSCCRSRGLSNRLSTCFRILSCEIITSHSLKVNYQHPRTNKHEVAFSRAT